ncbi:hypothetical protein PROFUN_14918 [Planoprotostelium fungivorum]|uniref:Uncharacterized protein n=1 Tax=Planoprotostelium fungivorum TaxID=1890364 RepID=A0A2P6MY70_9EUKA|nr:hypothetical protein PROFUN_14918 [Planoprotostelium fungivorum]
MNTYKCFAEDNQTEHRRCWGFLELSTDIAEVFLVNQMRAAMFAK